jgi:hypothetical protein
MLPHAFLDSLNTTSRESIFQKHVGHTPQPAVLTMLPGCILLALICRRHAPAASADRQLQPYLSEGDTYAYWAVRRRLDKTY